MPREDRDDQDSPAPRSWEEWREEASQSLDELDRALAQARKTIYRLRPMVRPKNADGDERPERQARPAQFARRGQGRRER